MDIFENIYRKPQSKPEPNPKGFIMHNYLFRKGSTEEKIMFFRYKGLNNNPRFLNEKRNYQVVNIKDRKW